MSSASPFSFHCIICFEEFDQVERFPVVLPCGHTYVCHECGLRLDKCMECRTSLYQEITVAEAAPVVVPPSRATGRTRRVRDPIAQNMRNLENSQQQQNAPTKKKTKERLPLPKNVVLLSLMEATAFTSKNAEHASLEATSHSPSFDERHEDENEEDLIRQNLSVVTSSCGTYAVATKKILTIFPTRPSKSNSLSSPTSSFNFDVDVQRIVNSTPTRNKHKNIADEENSVAENQADQYETSSMTLHYGDRVQVVSMNNGWAKLARGYGFVFCEQGTELVKVGNAVDKACRIEAVLHGLALRRNKIRREQDKLDSEGVGLMKAFQNSLTNDDDITVIDSSSFKNESPLSSRDKKVSPTKSSAKLPSQNESPSPTSPSSSIFRSAVSASPINLLFTRFNNEDEENQSPRSNIPQEPSPTDSPVINSNMLEGAREWRRKNLKPAARDIDFRTGMSGHLAVHSGGSHPHDFLGRQGHTSLKMSSHTGLNRPTNRRPNLGLPILNQYFCHP